MKLPKKHTVIASHIFPQIGTSTQETIHENKQEAYVKINVHSKKHNIYIRAQIINGQIETSVWSDHD